MRKTRVDGRVELLARNIFFLGESQVSGGIHLRLLGWFLRSPGTSPGIGKLRMAQEQRVALCPVC